MNHYIIYYSLNNQNWNSYMEVERMLAKCGDAWKKNSVPTFIRLDSELGLKAMHHRMLLTLNVKDGDTYYIAQIPTTTYQNGTTRLNRITNMEFGTKLKFDEEN